MSNVPTGLSAWWKNWRRAMTKYTVQHGECLENVGGNTTWGSLSRQLSFAAHAFDATQTLERHWQREPVAVSSRVAGCRPLGFIGAKSPS